jgi:hypothetical protein
MYLRRKYGNPRIDVVNRGRGGEEAIDELLRFDADIFAEKPSLVIWQVGTNAVFHKYNLDDVAAKISEGLARLREYPIDVVMMDPQYVTAMLLDDKADASERMVSLIAGAANKVRVNVFRRWALMRHWHVQNNIPFERMLDPTDPDKLHQNDWSTQRISIALCEAYGLSSDPMLKGPAQRAINVTADMHYLTSAKLPEIQGAHAKTSAFDSSESLLGCGHRCWIACPPALTVRKKVWDTSGFDHDENQDAC